MIEEDLLKKRPCPRGPLWEIYGVSLYVPEEQVEEAVRTLPPMSLLEMIFYMLTFGAFASKETHFRVACDEIRKRRATPKADDVEQILVRHRKTGDDR